jgi:hypothetical protein
MWQGTIDQAKQQGHPSSQVTPIAEFQEYYRYAVQALADDADTPGITPEALFTGFVPTSWRSG